MERLGRFLGAFLSVMLFMGIYSIAEEITLTTYYPAPYGAYDELTTTGNTYLATTSGNVGIGTTTPASKLEVANGTITAGNGGDVLVGRYSSTSPTTLTKGYFKLSTNNLNGTYGGLTINYLTADTYMPGITLNYAGKVGIGITDPEESLDVIGNIRTRGDFYDTSGMMPADIGWDVYVEAGTGRFGTNPASSIRYKENIVTLNTALEDVKALRPVYFDYKADYLPNATHRIGLIAEEAASINPLLAMYIDGRPEDVNYKTLTVLLVKAVQELSSNEVYLNRKGNVSARTKSSRTILNASDTITTNGAQGASGTFTTQDGKTVTVTNGIITGIQ